LLEEAHAFLPAFFRFVPVKKVIQAIMIQDHGEVGWLSPSGHGGGRRSGFLNPWARGDPGL